MHRATRELNDWTTFGRDLMVSVAGTARGRWHTGLCDQLRDAIRGGALRAGERLPSSRAVAHDLGISRGVVVGVYEQLGAEGYLASRHGSGTVVADVAPITTEPVFASAGGVADWELQIPPDLDLAGAEVTVQALVVDPGVNVTGAVASSAHELVVGIR